MRSAQTGTERSRAAAIRNVHQPVCGGSASRATQSTCTAVMPAAYRSAVTRPSRCSTAARTHWATKPTRMMR